MVRGNGTRDFDIVVLGATGFTGFRVLETLLKAIKSQDLKLRVGAAGRSRKKLDGILRQMQAADEVQVLLVDVTHQASLAEVAKATRLLLNCVGPYRYSGEAVVRACVAAKTDYLDVSGEPEFMEGVEVHYNEAAREAGCFVASACGFDSVPADLGTLFTARQIAVPSSVESFLSIHADRGLSVNYATWESAVMGISSAHELRALRQRAKTSGKALPVPRFVGPRLQPPAGASFDARVGTYVIPFPGSDASVVRRTQRALAALGRPPVQYAASLSIRSRITLAMLAVFSIVMRVLASFAFGRWLLLTFPGIFSAGLISRRGPSQEQLENTSFSMLFIGKGYSSGAPASPSEPPDQEVRVKLVGPELGYVATPIFMVEAAFTLLQEQEGIAKELGPGGVFTAGTLFANTTYIDRLQGAGISIQVLSGANNS